MSGIRLIIYSRNFNEIFYKLLRNLVLSNSSWGERQKREESEKEKEWKKRDGKGEIEIATEEHDNFQRSLVC